MGFALSKIISGIIFLTVLIAPNIGSTTMTVEIPLAKTEEYSITAEIEWKDEWFFESATEYNQDMAKAMIALSSAAYIDKAPEAVEESLEALGFSRENLYANYTVPTLENNDVASYVLGIKDIEKDGETKKLLAIVIKGTSGNEEWISNFNIGSESTNHLGFSVAATKIYLSVMEYCKEKGVDPAELTYFVTGHSRGAGVANLLAVSLTQATGADKNNIFAYTFASPRTTKSVDDGSYNNIFNIVSCEDTVTIIPFSEWGYRRYGVDMILPDRSLMAPENSIEMEKRNSEFVRNMVGISMPKNNAGAIATHLMTANLANSIPNVETFNRLMKGFKFSDYFSDEEDGDNSNNMMLGVISALGGGNLSDMTGSASGETMSMETLAGSQNSASVISHAAFLYYSTLASSTKEQLFGSYDAAQGYTFKRLKISGNADVTVHDKEGKLLCSINSNVLFMSYLAAYIDGTDKYIDMPVEADYSVTVTPLGKGKITQTEQVLNLSGDGLKVLSEEVITTGGASGEGSGGNGETTGSVTENGAPGGTGNGAITESENGAVTDKDGEKGYFPAKKSGNTLTGGFGISAVVLVCIAVAVIAAITIVVVIIVGRRRR